MKFTAWLVAWRRAVSATPLYRDLNPSCLIMRYAAWGAELGLVVGGGGVGGTKEWYRMGLGYCYIGL